ncbi:MAG: ATP-binding protein [Chloroflexota bacterium]|nr:ATP-binding protein [Chloroflexota bacterium]
MKIRSMELVDFSPIKHLQIDDMGDTIVIAGANGSGKTRLKDAIVATLEGNALMNMVIEATRSEEEDEKYFNGKTIKIEKGIQNDVLNNYINSRKSGAGRYVGSLVQIDSNRDVEKLSYNAVNWLGGDPDDVESAGKFYFSPFINRWQDFVNYIHQKTAARDKKIAEAVKAEPSKIGDEWLREHPDPLDKYKDIFKKALPGKELMNIDPARPREFRYKDESGQELNFHRLSSGEKEIVRVLFDVARKDIRHSIVIVDEPELHLHPTLAFQLIESLKAMGDHTNQFIFLTHSSDLITTYYSTGDVYFIDSLQDGTNQAHRLKDLVDKRQDLVPLIGQNIGLFAVGKKLVFVEGEYSSIDRLTYQRIAQTIDPEIRIIPAGSVLNIITLSSIEEQIRQSIFGIELYMVRDRDGLESKQIASLEKNGRIRCLKRRHLENYFLDEEVLFEVAQKLYTTSKFPNLSQEVIKNSILKIAQGSLGYNIYKNSKEYLMLNHFLKAPAVKSVEQLSVDEIKSTIVKEITNNAEQMASGLTRSFVEDWLNKEEAALNNKLTNGQWINDYQGKYIFSKVCADVLKEDQTKVRHAYVDIALTSKPKAIQDIIDIFKGM